MGRGWKNCDDDRKKPRMLCINQQKCDVNNSASEDLEEHDRENLVLKYYKQTVNRNIDTNPTAGEGSEGIENCFLET